MISLKETDATLIMADMRARLLKDMRMSLIGQVEQEKIESLTTGELRTLIERFNLELYKRIIKQKEQQ